MTAIFRLTLGRLALAVPLALVAMGGPAAAQQQPWAADPARPQAPRPTTKAARPAPKDKKEDAAAPRTGDAQLRQRIEQLEEQLADMQVTIGTFESLSKGGNGPAGSGSPTYRPAAGGAGVDQARVDSLETQIRALTAQMEQLAEQVRQLSRQRSDLPVGAGPDLPRQAAVPPRQAPGAPGFGQVTVRPGAEPERDPIGQLIKTPQDSAAPQPVAVPPAAARAGSPKELYETAYGYLLQQDYGAAEVAFDEFLRRYPGDRLAGDAQYWLGETLYVQRRFKPAGQAFLRVIEKHQASAKVPNSILKLALSLEQLGQKDCGLFTELETRYTNAPADVRSKARALKQRVGC